MNVFTKECDWQFLLLFDQINFYDIGIILQELQAGFQQESRRTGKDKLLLTLAAAGGTYFISRSYEPEKIVQ